MQNTGDSRTYYITIDGREVIIYSDKKRTQHDKIWCPCEKCDGHRFPADVLELIS